MGENQTNEAASGPTKYETLFGGVPLTVQVLAASGGGSHPAEVQVRQLPVKDYPAAFAAFGDEFKLAALYCGQPAGWAETLTPRSFSEVVVEGERVNADFFAWCERKLGRELALARRVAPDLVEAALKNLRSPLATSSPNSLPRRD